MNHSARLINLQERSSGKRYSSFGWMSGPTVLLVTHDLRESAYLANRIIVMSSRPGRVIEDKQVSFCTPPQCGNDVRASFCRSDAQLENFDRRRSSCKRQRAGYQMMAIFKRRFLSMIVILGFFALWEFACLVFHISDIVLPRPSQSVVELWERWPAIAPHVVQTLYTTMIGFALGTVLGVLGGVLIGSSRLAYDTAYPLLIGFNAIPKVAIVPFWFCGSGSVLYPRYYLRCRSQCFRSL